MYTFTFFSFYAASRRYPAAHDDATGRSTSTLCGRGKIVQPKQQAHSARVVGFTCVVPRIPTSPVQHKARTVQATEAIQVSLSHSCDAAA